MRLLKTKYFGNRSIKFRNSNEDVIYGVDIDINGSSFLVILGQLYDIIGEEDWIHSRVNFLSNLILSQTIPLSWGAKKKESIHQRSILSDEGLHLGNKVIVENHDIQWPHKAQIVDIDMINNTALVRWDTTRTKDLVDLKDLKNCPLRRHVQGNKNPQIFIILLQVKKLRQLSNVIMMGLLLKVILKIYFIPRTTLLSCVLKVQYKTQ